MTFALGFSGVGKSSLLLRFADNMFSGEYFIINGGYILLCLHLFLFTSLEILKNEQFGKGNLGFDQRQSTGMLTKVYW